MVLKFSIRNNTIALTQKKKISTGYSAFAEPILVAFHWYALSVVPYNIYR